MDGREIEKIDAEEETEKIEGEEEGRENAAQDSCAVQFEEIDPVPAHRQVAAEQGEKEGSDLG